MAQLWLPILICVICGVSGNLCLKAGMQSFKAAGSQPLPLQLILRILTNPVLLGGLVLYGFSMLSWLNVLSRNNLSFVYPLFVSMSFMLVMLGSAVLFKERVQWTQAAGCVVIILGIWIANLRN